MYTASDFENTEPTRCSSAVSALVRASVRSAAIEASRNGSTLREVQRDELSPIGSMSIALFESLREASYHMC